jgi:hypothetical protein
MSQRSPLLCRERVLGEHPPLTPPPCLDLFSRRRPKALGRHQSLGPQSLELEAAQGVFRKPPIANIAHTPATRTATNEVHISCTVQLGPYRRPQTSSRHQLAKQAATARHEAFGDTCIGHNSVSLSQWSPLHQPFLTHQTSVEPDPW